VLAQLPNTLKDSFQKVCLSAASLVALDQSLENLIARWRISFQESGMLSADTVTHWKKSWKGKARSKVHYRSAAFTPRLRRFSIHPQPGSDNSGTFLACRVEAG